MRPAGRLLRPARLFIYNKYVLCLRFNLLRTESEAQQHFNAEQSRRKGSNLRLSPYEGAALTKLSYTGIICFSASPACRPQLLGFSVRSNHWIWIERQNRFSFDQWRKFTNHFNSPFIFIFIRLLLQPLKSRWRDSNPRTISGVHYKCTAFNHSATPAYILYITVRKVNYSFQQAATCCPVKNDLFDTVQARGQSS